MTGRRSKKEANSKRAERADAASKDSCRPLSVSSAPNALAERIKELNWLYGISNLLENQDVSLAWIMQRAVELIPAAWQFPEYACARIRLDGQEYTSRQFKMTQWHQNTKIVVNGNHVGDVDVFYLQKPPPCDGKPSLPDIWIWRMGGPFFWMKSAN